MTPPPSFDAPAYGPPPPPSGGWPPPPWFTPPALWQPPPPKPPNFEIPGALRGRLIGLAAMVGVAVDLLARRGLGTATGTVTVTILAGALAVGSRARAWVSRTLLTVAALLSLFLAVRSSPWVVGPVVATVIVAVLLAASFARDRSAASTFPRLTGRLLDALGHVLAGLGALRPQAAGPEAGPERRGLLPVVRGLALAVPVVVVVGALLADADPVFGSWFDPPSLLGHAILIGLGAWLLLGLCRAAWATRTDPQVGPAPSVGVIEATSVLAALCGLYAAFVVAQVVAIAGGANHVLATRGLTYADYARQGFFQLLGAAAVTFAVLLSVRACTERGRRSIVVLSEVTVLLTLVVVGVAVRRLDLYCEAYGLTMLRLASTVTALWIGLVFLLLAFEIARPASRRAGAAGPGWFAPTVVASAMLTVVVWAASNPASLVARTNLSRAAHGRRFDAPALLDLGPDSMPTIVARIRSLDGAQQALVRGSLCGQRLPDSDGLRYNRSVAEARRALDELCS